MSWKATDALYLGVCAADWYPATPSPKVIDDWIVSGERTLDFAEFVMIGRIVGVDPYKILRAGEAVQNQPPSTGPS